MGYLIIIELNQKKELRTLLLFLNEDNHVVLLIKLIN